MILEFKIPNGDMTICVEQFMAEAGIRKIRKMLALYAKSDPDAVQVQALKDLLQEMARQSKGEEQRAEDNFKKAEAEVQLLERIYSQMKAAEPRIPPDYKRRWKEELSGIRSKLVFSKTCQKEVKSSETKARKRWKAYMDALAAVEEILG